MLYGIGLKPGDPALRCTSAPRQSNPDQGERDVRRDDVLQNRGDKWLQGWPRAPHVVDKVLTCAA
jgi:hypothetical protein